MYRFEDVSIFTEEDSLKLLNQLLETYPDDEFGLYIRTLLLKTYCRLLAKDESSLSREEFIDKIAPDFAYRTYYHVYADLGYDFLSPLVEKAKKEREEYEKYLDGLWGNNLKEE